jgi:hypothetical protein
MIFHLMKTCWVSSSGSQLLSVYSLHKRAIWQVFYGELLTKQALRKIRLVMYTICIPT